MASFKTCICCNRPFKRNNKFSKDQWEKAKYCSNLCASKMNSTHGLRNTYIYSRWHDIKKRCYDQNSTSYPYYGARGITMAEEWKDDVEAFYSHVGDPPDRTYQIGRIDNDKGYVPGNVRWETRTANMTNTRKTIKIFHDGIEYSMKSFCETHGLPYKDFHRKYKNGLMTIQDIVSASKS